MYPNFELGFNYIRRSESKILFALPTCNVTFNGINVETFGGSIVTNIFSMEILYKYRTCGWIELIGSSV